MTTLEIDQKIFEILEKNRLELSHKIGFTGNYFIAVPYWFMRALCRAYERMSGTPNKVDKISNWEDCEIQLGYQVNQAVFFDPKMVSMEEWIWKANLDEIFIIVSEETNCENHK